jgi:hypothetical protein
MTDQQLYLAIGVPILVNASVLVAVLLLVSGALNKRVDDPRDRWTSRIAAG